MYYVFVYFTSEKYAAMMHSKFFHVHPTANHWGFLTHDAFFPYFPGLIDRSIDWLIGSVVLVELVDLLHEPTSDARTNQRCLPESKHSW